MAGSVIKEFLIKLGVVTDEPAMKKLTDGVGHATKVVLALGASIEYASIKLARGVVKWSDHLEQLYFASKRTGASATNLRALGRAWEEMGGSMGEAVGAVKGLKDFLRSDYAAEGLLSTYFGVTVKDPKTGKDRDMVDVIEDIGKAMKGMTTQQALMLGANVGLSPDAIYQMREGDPKIFEAMRRSQGDLDGATKSAHAFMASLRHLGDVIFNLGVQFNAHLSKKFKLGIDDIANLIQRNGPKIVGYLSDIVFQLVDQLEKIVKWVIAHPEIFSTINEALKRTAEFVRKDLLPALQWIGEKFDWLNKKTNGTAGEVLGFVAALKLLGGGEIITGLTSLTGSLLGLLGPWGKIVAGGVLLGTLFDKFIAEDNTITRIAGNWLGEAGNNLFGGGNDRNALTSVGSLGWNDAQSAGILRAVQASSHNNPKQDYGDGTKGIIPFSQEDQDSFEKIYGHKIDGRNGLSPFSNVGYEQLQREQMEFLSASLKPKGAHADVGDALARAQSATTAASTFIRNYPGLGGSDPDEMVYRANRSGDFAPQTTINVTGVAGDPQSIAQQISDALQRTLAAVTRDLVHGVQ